MTKEKEKPNQKTVEELEKELGEKNKEIANLKSNHARQLKILELENANLSVEKIALEAEKMGIKVVRKN